MHFDLLFVGWNSRAPIYQSKSPSLLLHSVCQCYLYPNWLWPRLWTGESHSCKSHRLWLSSLQPPDNTLCKLMFLWKCGRSCFPHERITPISKLQLQHILVTISRFLSIIVNESLPFIYTVLLLFKHSFVVNLFCLCIMYITLLSPPSSTLDSARLV